MKKILLTMLMALTAGGMWAQTTGTLNVPEVTRRTGTVRQVIVVKGGERQGVIKVEISTNGNVYRDLQFSLTLPEGITLVESSGFVEAETGGHSMMYAPQADGSVMFIYYSLFGDLLEDGIAYEIPINVDSSFEQGSASLLLVEATDNEDVTGEHALPVSNFDIVALLLGDVNDDGSVDVQDITTFIDKIQGNDPDVFVEVVADIDNEGHFDVQDITGIVDIIQSKNPSSSAKAIVMDEESEIEPE